MSPARAASAVPRWAWIAAAATVVLLAAPAGATPTPTAAATPAPAGATATAQPGVQESVPVEGSGDPAGAPTLTTGLYLDLLRQPETLWYGVEAAAGQQAAVTVVIRGRPDGPLSENTQLRVQLLDAQRQPVSETGTDRFTGTVDARVELVGDPLPAVTAGAGPAYLTVTLADSTGAVDLAELGYQVEFAVSVTGETVTAPPAPNAPPTSSEGTASAGEETPGAAPAAAPAATTPDRAGDLLPIGLIALALGGALGFEGARRRR